MTIKFNILLIVSTNENDKNPTLINNQYYKYIQNE